MHTMVKSKTKKVKASRQQPKRFMGELDESVNLIQGGMQITLTSHCMPAWQLYNIASQHLKEYYKRARKEKAKSLGVG